MPETAADRPKDPLQHRALLAHPLLFFSALLLVAGAGLMAPHGNVFQVETLHQFWWGAGVMGAGFALSWKLQRLPLVWFWGVAIATRLLLLPMEPGDDVWRYIWEGQIQTLGFSPYHLPPTAPELVPFRTDWWGQINHPDVTAIYPPITQLGFRAIASLVPNLYLFKLAFVVADVAVCGLLCRHFGSLPATLYAWNPMIIYSFAGGAHYDSWFILPLVAAWFVLEPVSNSAQPPDRPSVLADCGSRRWLWGVLLLGISVAVKWVSLPLLGFLVWRSLRQRKPGQAVCTGLAGLLPMGLAALPFCHSMTCPLVPTRSAFVSYGRSAEFIPHFVAKLWPASFQSNWVYLIPLMLILIWLIFKTDRFQVFAAWFWFWLLLLTPIVHFWYFTWVVPFTLPIQNWGIRLVSLSAFIYFILPSRLPDWRLTEAERLWLWLPFVLGWLWTTWRQSKNLAFNPDFIESSVKN
jgi:alpha-1,6-mannosyltransferase